MENENLFREAAEDAIIKHLRIIEDLKDIISLKEETFRIVNNENEEEITGLGLTEFIRYNVERKVNSVQAYTDDIKTCYEQMGVFKIG